MRVLTSVLIAVTIASALAACPNSCSGHGRCSETDRCICFKSAGTVAGSRSSWTGEDCSQRVCPYGVSFGEISTATAKIVEPIGWLPETSTNANALGAYLVNGFQLTSDLNIEIEILSFTEVANGDGTGTYRLKRDTDRIWGAPVSFDSSSNGNGAGMSGPETAHEITVLENNVLKNSGVFIYFDTSVTTSTSMLEDGDIWFLNVTRNDGSSYVEGQDGTSHQMIECSGAGICDRTSGSCMCFPGRTGSNCARSMCPNSCSGHGICKSLQRFALDAGYTYDAFDATQKYGCSCDAGYRGPDCGMIECPAGPDPMTNSATLYECSRRGNCDFSTGTCRCAKGFYGERCESLSTLV